MWKTEASAETTASPSAVWQVLQDAVGWPSWNPGLASAQLDGPLQNGTTGRTKQANGPEGKFTVTDVSKERFFANEAKIPGSRLRFLHQIEQLQNGRSRITLGATMDGPLSPLYGLLFGRNIAGYMPTAVKQLAQRAEGEALH